MAAKTETAQHILRVTIPTNLSYLARKNLIRKYSRHFPWKKHTAYKKRIRLKIYSQDNFTCQYCDLNMRIEFELMLSGAIPERSCRITLDHIVAKKPNELIRNWEESNLATCCKRCNETKGGSVIFPF